VSIEVIRLSSLVSVQATRCAKTAAHSKDKVASRVALKDARRKLVELLYDLIYSTYSFKYWFLISLVTSRYLDMVINC